MGSFLDASAVITSERGHATPEEFLERVATVLGEQPIAMSTLVMTELLHGVFRDPDHPRRSARQRFYADLFSSLSVVSYTAEMAGIAARIGAGQAMLGKSIPPVDLMIGATALAYDYAILTVNERHFRMIPGLRLLTF